MALDSQLGQGSGPPVHWAHVRASQRAPVRAPCRLPPRRDARRRRRHGGRGGRSGHPVRRRAGHRCPRRREEHGQPPVPARDRAAGPEDPGGRRQGQRDRVALRREPHQRAPHADLPDDGLGHRLDRGLPVLPARRPRPEGHAACPRHQPGQRRRDPGWLVDHAADGEADAAQPGEDQGAEEGRHRRHLRPQDPRAPLRDRLRAEPQQGLDPRALPQHRLLRRRGVRRPGGCPPLLRRQRQGPQPAPVGDAGRPGEEPHRLRPDQLSRPRPRAAQRGAGPDGRAQRDPPRQGRTGQEAQARPARRARQERLRVLPGALLLRLRAPLPRARPRARQDRRGPQEAALLRRPDGAHHDRPARPGRRRQVRARARVPEGPGHRRPRDGRAAHR